MDGFTGEVFEGKVATKASEVIQVLVQKTLKPEESETYQALRSTDGLGRQVPQAASPHERRHARPGGRSRSLSVPRGLASAAPSTCSSITSTKSGT